MISIKVPPLGESIVEAVIGRWLKNEGDPVASGETIVELETDKITVEVPALRAGVLVKQLKGEGDVVTVDEELGQLEEGAGAEAGSGAGAPPETQSDATAGDSRNRTDAPATGSAPAPAPAPAAVDVKASPAARRLAAEEGVDLTTVQGTGRGGVVS